MRLSDLQFRGTCLDGPSTNEPDTCSVQIMTQSHRPPYRGIQIGSEGLNVGQAIEEAKRLCAEMQQEVWVREVLSFGEDDEDVVNHADFYWDEDAQQVLEQ